MEGKLNPGWINVLEEIVMEWFNKYSPCFMCVGRKPHPFGNESHTIYCGLTSILRRAKIVEGKYCPSQICEKQHHEHGKTAGLMLGM